MPVMGSMNGYHGGHDLWGCSGAGLAPSFQQQSAMAAAQFAAVVQASQQQHAAMALMANAAAAQQQQQQQMFFQQQHRLAAYQQQMAAAAAIVAGQFPNAALSHHQPVHHVPTFASTSDGILDAAATRAASMSNMAGGIGQDAFLGSLRSNSDQTQPLGQMTTNWPLSRIQAALPPRLSDGGASSAAPAVQRKLHPLPLDGFCSDGFNQSLDRNTFMPLMEEIWRK